MKTTLIHEIDYPDDPKAGSAGMTLGDLKKFIERCDALKFSDYECIPRFRVIPDLNEVWKIEVSR